MRDNEAILQEIIAIHQQGELEQAQALYQNHLMHHPDDLEALELLGIIFMQQGCYHDAKQQFDAIIAIDNQRSQVFSHLASAYKHLEDYENAERHYLLAIQLKPGYVDAIYKLGMLYQSYGQHEQAYRMFSDALHYDETMSDARHARAQILLKRKKIAEAKREWLLLLAQQPSHLMSQFYLGIIAYECQNLTEAETYFLAVLDKSPEHTDALSNLGAVLLKKDKIADAIARFIQTLKFDSGHVFAQTNLAAIYLSQGRVEEAKQHYFELLNHVPNDFTAHYNLAAIFLL